MSAELFNLVCDAIGNAEGDLVCEALRAVRDAITKAEKK